MTVHISPGLVIGDVVSGGGVIDDNNPIIGYQNLVTSANVTSTTAADGFPIENVSSPSTYLRWEGTSIVSDEYITLNLASVEDVDYVGIARHNFFSDQIPVSLEIDSGNASNVKLLLHFDGADASTTFTDSSAGAKTFTPAGNAQIDTVQSKFGGASGLFDGTGDWISTPDSADFILGSSDWTIEFQFNCNSAGGVVRHITGQNDNAQTNASTSFHIQRSVGNFIRAEVCIGTTSYLITSTTQFTNAINTGWHHLAFVRTGNTLKLFIDGVQEGGDLEIIGSINNSANDLRIGAGGEFTSDTWLGWIDEFRLTVGQAVWTSNFTPPNIAYPWVAVIEEFIPSSDGAILMRFDPQAVNMVRIRLQPGDAVPTAAVVYAGKLLVLQRRIYVGHTPINMRVSSTIINGYSENGQFLGRIVKSQTLKSNVTMNNMTPEWFRLNMLPFIQAAVEAPFFFAWRPSDYPEEVGFCWLTGDPHPKNQRNNGMMSVSLDLSGIAP